MLRTLEAIDNNEEFDPWYRPLLAVFVFNIVVLYFYQVSRWANLLHALISTKLFTDNPNDRAGKISPAGKEPHVTIQIFCCCCCNHDGRSAILEETIARACCVEWPREKLTVQILDGFTDDDDDVASAAIITAAVVTWRSRGVDITRIARPTRNGCKSSGNLHDAFECSIKGDFVAYFDARHHMERNFLQRAVPFFYDKDGTEKTEIGLVQAPWGYYNMHQNLLTECDSLGLDIHHVIEQTGRSAAYQCFGFNGTGGIWRKRAIADTGGWSWASAREASALSYNAYMKGYKFVYVRDIPQSLEVPGSLLAHIQQKDLCTKGFIQGFCECYRRIIVSRKFSVIAKLEAFCHLTSFLHFPCTGLLVFVYPFLVKHRIDGFRIMFAAAILIIEPILSALVACYAKVSEPDGGYRTFLERTARLFLIMPFLALKCGLILFETKSIFEGFFPDNATYVITTTPKEGSKGNAKMNPLKKSANNPVARGLIDNIIAVAGVMFGIHRLIFVVVYKTRSPFSDFIVATLQLLNAMLALSFIFINSLFFFEKYKQGISLGPFRLATKTLLRASKWPGFVPALITLCMFCYVVTLEIFYLPTFETPSSVSAKPSPSQAAQGSVRESLLRRIASKRAKRGRGKIYFCGSGGYPVAMKLFDDFFDDSIVETSRVDNVSLLSADAISSATSDDVFLIDGGAGSCNITLERLYETFSGKILLLNSDPTPERAMGNNTFTISWDRTSARNVHVPYVSIVLFNAIPAELGKVLIWKDYPRSRNSRQNFMVYASSTCIPFRDEVAAALSRVGFIHYGTCDPRQNSSSQNMARLPTHWLTTRPRFSNFQLFHDYRFCLVLESKLQPGFVTEKILMAFLGGCIPIWYGTTEIFDIFNRRAFLYLDGTEPKAIEILVKRVEQLERDPGLYEAMLQQPVLADGNITLQKYFSLDDSIGNGRLKHEIRVKMGLEERHCHASEILRYFARHPLQYDQIPHFFPKPDVDDYNMAAIYSHDAWKKLHTMLTTSDVTLLITGGSSMTGSGFVEVQDRCSNIFARSFRNVTVVDRAHGSRNSFHSMQCMHSFFPTHADVVLWEFAINDFVWNTNEEVQRLEQRNQFTLYTEQLVRVAKERHQKPPLVILLYLWDSPFRIFPSGQIHQSVFDSHNHVGENYDFVVGHVNAASYHQSLQMEDDVVRAVALGDAHHPNGRGHMILAYLLHDLVTNDKRLAKPKESHQTRHTFTWACGNESKEKRLVKDLLVNSHPLASFTAELPKNAEPLAGMLNPMDFGNLTLWTRGKANSLRQDRQQCYELPCCGASNVSFDVSRHSPFKGIHVNFSPNATNAEIFFNREKVTSELINAKSWDCLLGLAVDGASTYLADWVVLPRQHDVSVVSFCNNLPTCGLDRVPGSLPVALMSFTVYGARK